MILSRYERMIAKRYLLRSDGKTSANHKSKRGRELAEFVDDRVFYFFAIQERPKLFVPLEDEVRERLQYGFTPEKRGTPGLVLLPVGIFGLPLGVVSFSLVWLNIARDGFPEKRSAHAGLPPLPGNSTTCLKG